MGNNIMKYLLIMIFWAQIFQSFELTKACIENRVHIHVVNNLPPNPHKLEAHCASGDDDLGYQKLDRNKDLHWSFCTSILDNTLFFCHLWWNNKDRAFEAYRTKDHSKCENDVCYYAAKSDGIYYSNAYPPVNLTKMYTWNIHN